MVDGGGGAHGGMDSVLTNKDGIALSHRVHCDVGGESQRSVGV